MMIADDDEEVYDHDGLAIYLHKSWHQGIE